MERGLPYPPPSPRLDVQLGHVDERARDKTEGTLFFAMFSLPFLLDVKIILPIF